MTETPFTPGTVLCPTCKSRTFVQDEPWKLQCVTCYLANKSRGVTITPATQTTPIAPDMLRRLIQLCHPDRHGDSEAANIATRYLLTLRGSGYAGGDKNL